MLKWTRKEAHIWINYMFNHALEHDMSYNWTKNWIKPLPKGGDVNKCKQLSNYHGWLDVKNQAQPSLVCEHILRVYEYSNVKCHHYFYSINYVS